MAHKKDHDTTFVNVCPGGIRVPRTKLYELNSVKETQHPDNKRDNYESRHHSDCKNSCVAAFCEDVTDEKALPEIQMSTQNNTSTPLRRTMDVRSKQTEIVHL